MINVHMLHFFIHKHDYVSYKKCDYGISIVVFLNLSKDSFVIKRIEFDENGIYLNLIQVFLQW